MALLLAAGGLSYPAHAGDFFSNLFGVFGARPPAPPPMILPFGDDSSKPTEASRPRIGDGGGQA